MQESQLEDFDLQRKLTMRPPHEFKGSGGAGAGNAQIWLACFHLADDDQTKILELVMPRTRTL